MRYTTKAALVEDIHREHDRLLELLDEIATTRFRESGVWGDDWTLTDLVAHLAEWQTMFLGWYDAGRRGESVALPAPGYKWSETPRLNRAIWAKHRGRSTRAVRAEFDRGYERITSLVDTASDEELLAPGYFPWTRRNALTTYLGANTASHYRFACQVIARWLRHQAAQSPHTSCLAPHDPAVDARAARLDTGHRHPAVRRP